MEAGYKKKEKNSGIHLSRNIELYFTGRNIVNRGNITHIYVSAPFELKKKKAKVMGIWRKVFLLGGATGET